MKRCLLWFVLIGCLGIDVVAQDSPTGEVKAAMSAIRPDAIRAHMRFLSDSLLQGRAPGTLGYEVAARYVAAQLEAAGLHPGGVNGSWYQTVPLRKAVLDDGKSSLVLIPTGHQDKRGEQALISLNDYVLYGDLNRTDTSLEAPVVFAGFGVTAKEHDYDDYAGADVKGKIVVVIDGAPAKFPSTVRAYYSDSLVKQRNAVAHGAVGFIDMMTPEDQKRYPWEWTVPQVQMGSMEWLEKNGSPHNTFPELRGAALLNQSGAEKLFAGAGRTLAQIFETARLASRSRLLFPSPSAFTRSVHRPRPIARTSSARSGAPTQRCVTSMWSIPRMSIIWGSARPLMAITFVMALSTMPPARRACWKSRGRSPACRRRRGAPSCLFLLPARRWDCSGPITSRTSRRCRAVRLLRTSTSTERPGCITT